MKKKEEDKKKRKSLATLLTAQGRHELRRGRLHLGVAEAVMRK